MSSDIVRELFRNLENVLHDRLKVIEDILGTMRGDTDTSGPLSDRLSRLEAQFHSLDEYAMGQVRTLAYNHDQLENRVELMEKHFRAMTETLAMVNATVGSLQTRMDDGKPVEAAEVEAEIEETEEAALNADLNASETEKKAHAVLVKAVEELEEEQEEEEEDEQEEEEEELQLEEFEFKKRTYYRDQNNNVYVADEEGCVDPNEVVGIWNPKLKKIERIPSA